MARKIKSKTRKARQQISKPQPEQTLPPIQEEDKPFDFGGLPNRDLKKNLGCG
jgi:hypothetical protein